MSLGRLWAGKAYGTNIGNLFVKLEGEDASLSGTLHFNEPNVGVVVYNVTGSFEGDHLNLSGEPHTLIENAEFGPLKAEATLTSDGEFQGEWITEIGTAGTFTLFPHDQAQHSNLADHSPDQLHTARHQFAAIKINREQIISVAESIQSELKSAQVIVTVLVGTEQTRYLRDFRKLKFSTESAELLKIAAQEPEAGGTNKVIVIEFGQHYNSIMTQSRDESWALGKLEQLKRDLQSYEQSYAINTKKVGISFYQGLLIAVVIILPDLPSLTDRATLMISTLVAIVSVDWLHQRFLPHAAIYLGAQRQGMAQRVAPKIWSWVMTVVAGTVIAVLGAYLVGLLGLSTPN